MARLRFRTISASEAYGCVQPGGEADVPEEFVEALLEGGYAERVEVPSERVSGERETAMLSGEEQAVSSAATPKRRK